MLLIAEKSVLDGLAIDVVRNRLYFADSGNGQVVSISTDGAEPEVLVSDEKSKPRSVALDANTGLVQTLTWDASRIVEFVITTRISFTVKYVSMVTVLRNRGILRCETRLCSINTV